MSTPLFKEALIESKKLREAALEEAKQAVLDGITPMIKQILDKEISGGGSGGLTLLEQQEEEETLPPTAETPAPAEPAPAPTGTPAPAMTAATPTTDAPVSDPTGVEAPATQVPAPDVMAPVTQPTPAAAPIVSSGMNVPMPDASGNITVNFADLFATVGGGDVSSLSMTPSEPTMPVEQEPMPTADNTGPGSSAEVPVEPTESPEQAALMESMGRLHTEFTTVLKNGTSVDSNTKNKLEQRLFETYKVFESIKSTLDSEDSQTVEAYLGALYERLLDSAKNNNSYTQRNEDMATKSLKEFAVALFEEIDAKGSDAHGSDDGGEQAKQDVVNSNESDKPSNHAMKASKSTPVSDPGKKESLTVKESNDPVRALEEELKNLLELDGEDGEEALEECGDMMEMDGHSDEQKHVTVDINVNVKGSEGLGLDDAAMLDVGGSEEDSEGELDVATAAADDDDMVELDLEDDEEEVESDEEEVKSMVAESVLAKKNAKLQQQLQETQLLTARSLYVNKLFARDNLSSGQKRTIVKYLDGARTIQEAKEVFFRIKKVLDKAESGKSGLNESASQRGTSLNESTQLRWVKPTEVTFHPDRWAELAGITKKRA